MPGFMQSFKSPFSPNTKNAPIIAPTEVVAAAEEAPTAQEQLPSEALPAEALLQYTSSTVALTLTPANGESSQQATSETAEVDQEPITPSELPVLSESAPEVTNESEPTDVQTEARPSTEAVQELHPVAPEADVAAAQLSSDLAEDVAPVSEPTAPASEPTAMESQPPTEDNQPTQELTSDVAVPSNAPASAAVAEEAPNADLVPTPTEAEPSKPAAKANKEGFSYNLKRSKSRKQKADTSAQDTEAGQSVSAKPRKSHPLADKLRSVIEQVKSKVKKDKETALLSPVVAAVEPTPLVEEVAASA